MFQGDSIRLTRLDEGFVELCFDAKDEPINKLDARTVNEFRQATELLAKAGDVRGVLVTSAKDVFIVGADIKEFGEMFKDSAEQIASGVLVKNQIFVAFEDLPFPSVVAINGFALGGGLELALAASHRVMSTAAQVGVPEVKLGLFPGFGGTVRLSRVAGAQAALDWIASGKPAKAPAAKAAGVVDEVAEPAALRAEALALLRGAADGQVNWQAAQARKRNPLPLSDAERQTLFATAVEKIKADSPPHQPAALIAAEMMAEAAAVDRAKALALEAAAFGRVAKTQAAGALVQVFLNDQLIKKVSRKHTGQGGGKVKQLAVLGAGIMGGGIAYTAALRGTPVLLKDIASKQLDLGVGEASKLLARQVKSGRLAQDKADAILQSIKPQLDDRGFDAVDLVIEAVVERLDIKQQVLGVLEGSVRNDAIIASNTSSLRIDDIARPLLRPENIVGMHFFNPVPVMPLVEVIRGVKTSDAAVATAVSQALAMGKTPIVVKDCPGFLVNRIVTPYVNAFLQLVADGADFEEVDRVMEAFGWPMGPAYLQDVVGMDVGSHVGDVISAGYPERMKPVARNVVKLMVSRQRYGQKTGEGFYRYAPDAGGKPRKTSSPEAHELVRSLQTEGQHRFTSEEIVERMMLPMIIESAHALEDGVVASAAEVDMALMMGLGLPAYLGGALKYADWLGLPQVVALSDRYASLGPAYHATARMRAMAAQGESFHR